MTGIGLIPRPMPLPTSMSGCIQTFAGLFFDAFPADERQGAAHDEALDLLHRSLCGSSGNWSADYVRLRISAKRAQ